MSIRVRFAPSPTGPLHMGGVRTALYNYLFARNRDGVFILRIEDTDQNRFVQGAEEYIMEALDWCGIRVDEGVREGGPSGPYRQSERKEIYRQYAQQLIDNGRAYYAFDTGGEIEKRRREAGGIFAYDQNTRMEMRNSLSLSEEEVKKMLVSGVPYVIRFKMPADEEIIMQDIIRGEVRVNSNTLDDKVLYKSDGMPTYHLAHVVDDHLMEISHVIRGEEWLPSLPLHYMLYKAFGWSGSMPRFAHLPLILKPTGSGKLSKRDGDKMGFPVFPIDWKNSETGEVYPGYREAGYFPEAFVNILALLGWNDQTDREIYSMDELIKAFSLERVGKAGSRFDPDKARWFNHQYLIKKSDREISKEWVKILEAKSHGSFRVPDPGTLEKIVGLVKERVDFVPGLWDQAWFFFEAPQVYDEKTVRKRWKEETPGILKEIMEEIRGIKAEKEDPEVYEKVIKDMIGKHQWSLGGVMNALRLCLVGKPMGPGVFDIMAVLGKKETISRIEAAINTIKTEPRI